MRLFKVVAFLLLVFSFQSVEAQVYNPATWKKYIKHVSGNQYDIVFTVSIDNGWYVYSQHIEGDDGPIPTFFEFTPPAGVQLVGKTKESGNRKSGFDPVFKMNVTKYAKKATFKQRIKVSDPYKTYTIKGAWEFMTCNHERCLSPKYTEFTLKTKALRKQTPPKKPDNPKPSNNDIVDVQPSQPVSGTVDNSNFSQYGLPVKWAVEGLRVSKNEYDITFTANVKNGWELYSQYTGGKGPMPLAFNYDNRDERLKPYKRIKTDASSRIRSLDNKFGVVLTRYKDQVSFTQRVKIEKGSRSVKGDLNYVASNPTGNTILPPQRVSFSIDLPSKITPTEAMLRQQEREREKLAAENAKNGDDEEGEGENEEESEPEEGNTDIAKTTAINGQNGEKPQGQFIGKGNKFNYTYAVENCSGETAEMGSNLWVFLLGLSGGLLALLTPCIFPMIPITVSFFTKRSKTRAQGIGNALAYGLSIIAIYVTLGLVITSIFGAEALNAMSTNVWFNLLFFIVFVAFALSFFGFYELTLPSSWSTWSDDASDKGGLLGIFFMAFTLSIVSFSCTGPIIGTLLAETANGGGATILGRIPVRPLLGMLGFSTALALPFALFAMFPSWLNSLPQSGGWMNTVKVFLGFLELALALKFLSTADLVYNTGILKIEAFLGLWIAVFIGMATYMFGFLKLPLDFGPPKITKGKYVIGLMSLAFVGYLSYGLLTYEPLKVLSGIAPPVTYNFFRNEAGMEYPDCPNGIRCYKDYDEALAVAQEENIPVMIDFTGHGCVNCRKMEETVWREKDVKEVLATDFVLVSLYVDERKKLDKPYRTESGQPIRTIGNKWSQFQLEHFNSNSQPLYVIVSPDEKILNKPQGFENGDKQVFMDFLQCGLQRFEQEKQ